MKLKREELNENENACCAPTNVNEKTESCCAQPTDGSDCCDKSESKVVNAEKTGCC